VILKARSTSLKGWLGIALVVVVGVVLIRLAD